MQCLFVSCSVFCEVFVLNDSLCVCVCSLYLMAETGMLILPFIHYSIYCTSCNMVAPFNGFLLV